MKSDLFLIDSNSNVNVIPDEVERVAIFCKLNEQNAMTMRLLTEEMLGLLQTVSNDYSGNLWVENKGNNFEIHMEIETVVDFESKNNLIDVKTEGHEPKGVLGKISSFFSNISDSLTLASGAGKSFPVIDMDLNNGYASMLGGYYIPVFSMNEYKNTLGVEEKKREWDGLEKSILVNIADDIILGVKDWQIKMITKKAF